MQIKQLCGPSFLLLPLFLLSQAACARFEIEWPAVTPTIIPAVTAGPTPDSTREALPVATRDLPAAAAASPTPGQTAPPAPISPSGAEGGPAGPASIESATPVASPEVEATPAAIAPPVVSRIGTSAGGRAINSYRFGFGNTDVVIVGGMHGGYEWNAILLAQSLIDHYYAGGGKIRPTVSLHVIPNANPDGLALATGKDPADLQLQPTDIITHTLSGRFNANGVDLNRNWDCNWSEQALWRDQPISGGTHPFSEPETESLRRFFLDVRPNVVVFLHSAADGIFSAGCPGPDPASSALAAVYGSAAGYPVYPSFDHYVVTGDASDWLTTQGIPSFTVELSTHEATDREQNLAGLRALLTYLSAREAPEPE